MTRRRPRSLRPDEEHLWRRITATASPLHPERVTRAGSSASERISPETAASRPDPAPKTPIQPFEVGSAARPSTAIDRAPDPQQQLADAPLRIDRKIHSKLKKGRVAPEARIDLHGMTLAQAQAALTGFVTRSHAEGRRLLLVITGKGRTSHGDDPVPVRRGMLRHQVPDWLGRPPLSAVVQQVLTAHRSHGGSGAYYVYLRRRR